jgi:hypothetical protein
MTEYLKDFPSNVVTFAGTGQTTGRDYRMAPVAAAGAAQARAWIAADGT